MSTINELIIILPQIVVYIIVGYVFVKSFHFVALRQNSMNVENVLTLSLVTGYIYCQITYLIPYSISYKIDHVFITISAIGAGYVLGKLAQSKICIKILDILKIRNTFNAYFWDDLMDGEYPMKVKVYYADVCYEGMLHNYENFSNDPHMVLASYVMKKNNSIIEDKRNCSSQVIVLNTVTASRIDIIYNQNSAECTDIRQLCDSNSE